MIKKIFKWLGISVGALFSALLIYFTTASLSSHFTQYQDQLTTPADSLVVYQNLKLIDPVTGDFSKRIIVTDGNTVKYVGTKLPDQYRLAEVVDLNDKFVLPGLIDAHVHVFDHRDLASMLAAGITAVRNMMGFPIHLTWKRQIEAGNLTAPHLITASPTLNAGEGGGPFHKKLRDVNELTAAMTSYAEQGYDFFKFYDGLTPQMYRQLVTTANELNKTFSGHAPESVELESLLKSKPTSLEHVEEIFNLRLGHKSNIEKLKQIAKTLANYQQTIVPTRVAFWNIYQGGVNYESFVTEQRTTQINPFVSFIGSRMVQKAEHPNYIKYLNRKEAFMQTITTTLHKSGVPLAMGTDTGPALTIPGKTYLKEIELMQQSGISNLDIIRMATVNAAPLMINPAITGRVEANTVADFVVLNDNPLNNLETLATPSAVVSQGRLLDQQTLDALRQHGAAKTSLITTVGHFINHLFSL